MFSLGDEFTVHIRSGCFSLIGNKFQEIWVGNKNTYYLLLKLLYRWRSAKRWWWKARWLNRRLRSPLLSRGSPLGSCPLGSWLLIRTVKVTQPFRDTSPPCKHCQKVVSVLHHSKFQGSLPSTLSKFIGQCHNAHSTVANCKTANGPPRVCVVVTSRGSFRWARQNWRVENHEKRPPPGVGILVTSTMILSLSPI